MPSSRTWIVVRTLLLVGIGAAVGIAVTLSLQKTPHAEKAAVSLAEDLRSGAGKTPGVPTVPADFNTTGNTFGTAGSTPPDATGDAVSTPPTWVTGSSPTHNLPAGRDIEYTQTTSGYTVSVGRRAVDYEATRSATMSQPPVVEETEYLPDPDHPIGRNGLQGNPCVDPPSSHGAAYTRAY